MRTLIARVFDYSLDGLIATEETEFFQFCRDLPDDPAEDARGREFYAGADLHIMGRVAYQSMASYFPTTTGDPNAEPLNAARKVVFSRTLKTAGWAGTTIASGDLGQEIDKLRRGDQRPASPPGAGGGLPEPVRTGRPLSSLACSLDRSDSSVTDIELILTRLSDIARHYTGRPATPPR